MATYSSSFVARSFVEKGDVDAGIIDYDFRVISAAPIVTELSGFIVLRTDSDPFGIKGLLTFHDSVLLEEASLSWLFDLKLPAIPTRQAYPATAEIKDNLGGQLWSENPIYNGPMAIKTHSFNYFLKANRIIAITFNKFICPPDTTFKIHRLGSPIAGSDLLIRYNLTFVEFSET